jgi:hypothetical protein
VSRLIGSDSLPQSRALSLGCIDTTHRLYGYSKNGEALNLTANKRVVARFFELLNAGAYDEAVSLFTNDFIWSIPESSQPTGSALGP